MIVVILRINLKMSIVKLAAFRQGLHLPIQASAIVRKVRKVALHQILMEFIAIVEAESGRYLAIIAVDLQMVSSVGKLVVVESIQTIRLRVAMVG